jgi:hypothetical protein
MDKTIDYIHLMRKHKRFAKKVSVKLTGLIFYNNIEQSLLITKQVYDLCLLHQQPQCQIYFTAIISQSKYSDLWTSLPYWSYRFRHKR